MSIDQKPENISSAGIFFGKVKSWFTDGSKVEGPRIDKDITDELLTGSKNPELQRPEVIRAQRFLIAARGVVGLLGEKEQNPQGEWVITQLKDTSYITAIIEKFAQHKMDHLDYNLKFFQVELENEGGDSFITFSDRNESADNKPFLRLKIDLPELQRAFNLINQGIESSQKEHPQNVMRTYELLVETDKKEEEQSSTKL